MRELSRLYVITDRACAREGPGSVPEAVEAAARAGARFFQFRDKDRAAGDIWSLGRTLRPIAGHHDMRWLVNDRADVAALLGADGVHRPGDGLPVSAIRRLLADPLVGVSTHNLREARAAEEAGADFVTFSPIFRTDSKPGHGPPLGLDVLDRVTDRLELPVYALAGITPDRATRCLEAGARGVAVMSGIMAADDPGEATARYLEAIRG